MTQNADIVTPLEHKFYKEDYYTADEVKSLRSFPYKLLNNTHDENLARHFPKWPRCF